MDLIRGMRIDHSPFPIEDIDNNFFSNKIPYVIGLINKPNSVRF